MKQITGNLVFATAALSVGLLVSNTSMASTTTSPRHGQQTVDVSGGANANPAPQAMRRHQMSGMSMMNSGKMRSRTSPRHGQQTVDVSGGANANPASQASNRHQMSGMSMMNSDKMANMDQCAEMMRARANADAPGNMVMAHRSDRHSQMHANMRQCMEKMHSGGMSMEN